MDTITTCPVARGLMQVCKWHPERAGAVEEAGKHKHVRVCIYLYTSVYICSIYIYMYTYTHIYIHMKMFRNIRVYTGLRGYDTNNGEPNGKCEMQWQVGLHRGL